MFEQLPSIILALTLALTLLLLPRLDRETLSRDRHEGRTSEDLHIRRHKGHE